MRSLQRFVLTLAEYTFISNSCWFATGNRFRYPCCHEVSAGLYIWPVLCLEAGSREVNWQMPSNSYDPTLSHLLPVCPLVYEGPSKL